MDLDGRVMDLDDGAINFGGVAMEFDSGTIFCNCVAVNLGFSDGHTALVSTDLNVLKLNIMQMETPGGNNCYLVTNDVQK